MSLTKREKNALNKFVRTYTAELNKVLGKRPVNLNVKSLAQSVPLTK